MSTSRQCADPRELGFRVSATEMVQVQSEAILRLAGAQCAGRAPDPMDVLTVLAAGHAAAEAVTASRWCYVRDGLRLGLSVAQLARALDLTETELAAGYRSWVAGQRRLRDAEGRWGMTESEAEESLELLGPHRELRACGTDDNVTPLRRR